MHPGASKPPLEPSGSLEMAFDLFSQHLELYGGVIRMNDALGLSNNFKLSVGSGRATQRRSSGECAVPAEKVATLHQRSFSQVEATASGFQLCRRLACLALFSGIEYGLGMLWTYYNKMYTPYSSYLRGTINPKP